MKKPVTADDFKSLESEGKTVVYRHTKKDEQPNGWEFSGKKETGEKTTYSWFKVATFEEAEQYELENDSLN